MVSPPLDPTFENVKVLSNSIWGHPEAIVKRDDHIGVDYIDLTQHMVALDYLFGEIIQRQDKILIRDEYRLTMHELETNAMYSDGAYITGHPGIGKTLFFAYVLISCLGKRRPVAWQLTDGQPFYILFKDTASLHSIYDTGTILDHGPLWGLSDSNANVQIPPPVFFKNPESVKTIQSTSPRVERWKPWSKYVGATCYVMDIWSEKEIIDLAWVTHTSVHAKFNETISKLLGLPVERMTTLAKSWGGVPRNLLESLRMDDTDIEIDYREAARVAVQRCRASLFSTSHGSMDEDGSSMFYFCRPAIIDGITIRRLRRAYMETPTLRRFLGEALRQQDNTVKLDFFRAMSQADETRQGAGYIYESWFHIYLSSPSTIQCHWVQGSSGVSSLIGSSNLVNTTLDAVSTTKPPYYWVAPKNFHGINSALVLDDAIYAFQVTISSRRKSPLEGLKTLRNHLPGDLKDLPWSVVFVGDRDDAIAGVAYSWVNKFFFPAQGTRVSIGWSKVNPVDDDSFYKEIREESDPDVVME